MAEKTTDILRNSPLYSQAEAARYLLIPPSTLRYWAIGESTNTRTVKPVIETPKGSSQLSFLNLVELHILDSLRKSHKIDFPTIRKSLEFVKRELDTKRPLLDEEFETDGVSLFVDRYGKLINVSQEGQEAMRAVLHSSLNRVERDSRHIPIKLFPYTQTNLETSPRLISMSPSLFSGRPVINGTGISTMVIASRYKAGDSVEELSSDFNQPSQAIQEAIRCELQFAA